MAMVSTLFFAWGFLTCLNDILIPHLKNIFDLNYAEVMLVQFAFFSSYFIFSMPSGKIVEWFGYKRAMVTGLLTMATGAILFVPAASIPSFPLFLAALIVLAAGMTVLQTSANPYVTISWPAAHRLKPFEPYPGAQLSGYHGCAKVWQLADSGRSHRAFNG
jgi:FHS family L-fucose permease-like MFS transporter